MSHRGKPVKWFSITTGELKEESTTLQESTVDSDAAITDVTKSPQTLYCCHMCNACMNTDKELFQHVQEEHSGNDSASLSSHQSSALSETNSLSQHEPDLTLHQCPSCSFSSYVRSDLEKHSKEHSARKGFRCFYCDYSCLYRSEAKRHCQRKHPGRRIAFVTQNTKPPQNVSKSSSSLSGRPRVMLTNLLSLNDNKLRGLLESNKIRTIHTFQACDVEVATILASLLS